MGNIQSCFLRGYKKSQSFSFQMFPEIDTIAKYTKSQPPQNLPNLYFFQDQDHHLEDFRPEKWLHVYNPAHLSRIKESTVYQKG